MLGRRWSQKGHQGARMAKLFPPVLRSLVRRISRLGSAQRGCEPPHSSAERSNDRVRLVVLRNLRTLFAMSPVIGSVFSMLGLDALAIGAVALVMVHFTLLGRIFR